MKKQKTFTTNIKELDGEFYLMLPYEMVDALDLKEGDEYYMDVVDGHHLTTQCDADGNNCTMVKMPIKQLVVQFNKFLEDDYVEKQKKNPDLWEHNSPDGKTR